MKQSRLSNVLQHADLIITDQHEKISAETETFYLDTNHDTVLFVS